MCRVKFKPFEQHLRVSVRRNAVFFPLGVTCISSGGISMSTSLLISAVRCKFQMSGVGVAKRLEA